MYKHGLKCLTYICKRNVIQIKLPCLSPTMEVGTIALWNAKEGDAIKPGQIIASIETDKAAVDFESTDDFIMVKHIYPEGSSNLPVNCVIALAAEDEDEIEEVKKMDIEQFKIKNTDSASASTPEPKKEEIEPVAIKRDDIPSQKPSEHLKEEKILISPSAKAVFETNNLTFKSAFSHK